MFQKIEESKRGLWRAQAIFAVVCGLVIGTFIWSAEPGFLEFFPGDAYYNLLVKGFQAGQLNVKRDPAPGLAQLPNPYDPAANAQFVEDDYHQARDMSYYQGKLYLYFGVTPALVLFWPYTVLTGHYLSQTNATVIFCLFGFLAAAGLVYEVRRRYFPETNIWVAASGVIVIGFATGMLEILSSCDVYEVASSCGFAFTMLALGAIWCAWHQPGRKMRWLLLASFAYGLAIGARPTLLFGAIILLLPVVQGWHETTERDSWRKLGPLFVSAIGPLMFIGVGLMFYNEFRFGNPFEFGWHYQLADVQASAAPQFSLHYLWFNFRVYFLKGMQWSPHFPFLQAIQLLPLPPGYDGTGTDAYSGILADYPAVWLALAAPLAWKIQPQKTFPALRWFVTAVFLLFATGATTICLFQTARCRYELDFLPALMLLAVIGIFCLEGASAGRLFWRYAVRFGWCLLLAYSVLFNVLASTDAHAIRDYFVGNYFFNHQKMDQAVAFFGKASHLEPQSAAWHFALGNALSRSGRLDESIFQFQKALEINPDYAEAENNLGFTLLQAGRLSEAIESFQRALKTQKTYQAYYNLAYVLRRSGRAADAITNYLNCI
jgi:tetratricopeptide (TPR) repeat protein